jgi:hypothetical protein
MRQEQVFRPNPAVWIRTRWSAVEPGGRIYFCWQPNYSMMFYDSKSVLKFFKYPKNTDTRKALEEFLNEIDQQDAARLAKQSDQAGDCDPVPASDFFDPGEREDGSTNSGTLDASDPNFATRMIT